MSFHKYPPSDASAAASTTSRTVDTVQGIGANGAFEVTGANLIPRSSSATGLQINNGLAAAIVGAQVVCDLGEFVSIYSDAACTVLLATMVLTPDETVLFTLPIGSSVYLRAIKDVDIDQPGSYLAMNFLG